MIASKHSSGAARRARGGGAGLGEALAALSPLTSLTLPHTHALLTPRPIPSHLHRQRVLALRENLQQLVVGEEEKPAGRGGEGRGRERRWEKEEEEEVSPSGWTLKKSDGLSPIPPPHPPG